MRIMPFIRRAPLRDTTLALLACRHDGWADRMHGFVGRVRSDLHRLSPQQALEEQARGAVLIDLRTLAHRADSVEIPGALVIDLTVLPWRLDPTFEWRIPEAISGDQRYVLICRHGYSSSLAA